MSNIHALKKKNVINVTKKCKGCNSSVHLMDPQINIDGDLFHVACAKCAENGCGTQLTLANCVKVANQDKKTILLCRTHYNQRSELQGTTRQREQSTVFTGTSADYRAANGRFVPPMAYMNLPQPEGSKRTMSTSSSDAPPYDLARKGPVQVGEKKGKVKKDDHYTHLKKTVGKDLPEEQKKALDALIPHLVDDADDIGDKLDWTALPARKPLAGEVPETSDSSPNKTVGRRVKDDQWKLMKQHVGHDLPEEEKKALDELPLVVEKQLGATDDIGDKLDWKQLPARKAALSDLPDVTDHVKTVGRNVKDDQYKLMKQQVGHDLAESQRKALDTFVPQIVEGQMGGVEEIGDKLDWKALPPRQPKPQEPQPDSQQDPQQEEMKEEPRQEEPQEEPRVTSMTLNEVIEELHIRVEESEREMQK